MVVVQPTFDAAGGVHPYENVAVEDAARAHEAEHVVGDVGDELGVVVEPPRVVEPGERRLAVHAERVEAAHPPVPDGARARRRAQRGGGVVVFARDSQVDPLEVDVAGGQHPARRLLLLLAELLLVEDHHRVGESTQEVVVQRAQRFAQLADSSRLREVVDERLRSAGRRQLARLQQTHAVVIAVRRDLRRRRAAAGDALRRVARREDEPRREDEQTTEQHGRRMPSRRTAPEEDISPHPLVCGTRQ